MHSVVLDIETLAGVNFASLRQKGGGFKSWDHKCWAKVHPAQVCAKRVNELWEVVDSMECVVHPLWYGELLVFDNPYCRLNSQIVAEGVPASHMFEQLNRVCEGASCIIGYNVSFDTGVLRHHASRMGMPLPDIPDKCLMDASATAMGQKKWPKLQDAFRSICNQVVDEDMTHDAGYDVFMTLELAKALHGTEI